MKKFKSVKAAPKKVSKKPSKPAVVAAPVPKNSEDKWRAEEDARTLARAEEIKRDKKRLGAAKGIAKKQIAELSKVVGT